MTARTHDSAALTSLLIAVILIDPRQLSLATAILAVFASLVGGIAPDIDQPTAPLWRNLPVGRYIGKLFAALAGGHRFISHSLLGLALFSYGVHILLVFTHPLMQSVNIGYVTWAFALGMLSHLLTDSFTKEGVPWLLPVPTKFGFPPLRKLRLTTGKSVELRVLLPALVLLNGYVLFAHYGLFIGLLHGLQR